MARKKPINHENQSELPFDQPPTDGGSDTPAVDDIPEGVSVSLQERAETIARAAEMYAKYNKLTVGLGKAARIPEEIVKLNDRYGADRVPGVVAGAAVNSFYGPSPSEIDIDNPTGEMAMLEGVLKTRELLASDQFSKHEIEADIQPLIVRIRHDIGTAKHGVKAEVRNANVKKAKLAATRAARYAR